MQTTLLTSQTRPNHTYKGQTLLLYVRPAPYLAKFYERERSREVFPGSISMKIVDNMFTLDGFILVYYHGLLSWFTQYVENELRSATALITN